MIPVGSGFDEITHLARVERITPRQNGILLAVTLVLFSAKLNTVFLVLLPARKFPSRRAFWLFWGGVIALFAVVVIGWNLLVYSSFYLYLVIAGLALSLYPLMFLVWHAEPLEIERRAANIILQFRLAGWLALAYWASGQRGESVKDHSRAYR